MVKEQEMMIMWITLGALVVGGAVGFIEHMWRAAKEDKKTTLQRMRDIGL